jgi:hypothetical protein
MIRVNFRKPFDFSTQKYALFETFRDATEFRNVMKDEGYVTFEPYEENKTLKKNKNDL